MGAGIEWIPEGVQTGALRIGRQFRSLGDPYEFSCTVIRKGDEVSLVAASAATICNLLRERKALRAILEPLGVREVVWRRIKNGIHRTIRRKL